MTGDEGKAAQGDGARDGGNPAGAAAGFWDFTLDFYGGDGISDCLVRLQDECGLDVNVLLLAVWRGLQGRLLVDAAAAEKSIATWREEVTEPLRDLRRRLKAAGWTALPAGLVAAAEGPFREQLKALEIDSERLTQAALEAAPTRAAATGADAAVAANLAAVRGLAGEAAARQAEPLCAVLERAAAAYAAPA